VVENEQGECDGESMETEICVEGCCPVDCEHTDWQDVPPCINGVLQQQITIITEASCEGVACPEVTERTVACAHETCVTASCPCEIFNYDTRDDFGYVLDEPADVMALAGSGSVDGVHTADIIITRPSPFCFGKLTLEVKCIRRVFVMLDGGEIEKVDVDVTTPVSEWMPVTLTVGECKPNISKIQLVLKRRLDCGADLFKDIRNLQLESCVS
jgi:hypothetical protein